MIENELKREDTLFSYLSTMIFILTHHMTNRAIILIMRTIISISILLSLIVILTSAADIDKGAVRLEHMRNRSLSSPSRIITLKAKEFTYLLPYLGNMLWDIPDLMMLSSISLQNKSLSLSTLPTIKTTFWLIQLYGSSLCRSRGYWWLSIPYFLR